LTRSEVEYVLDTFPIVREREETLYGTYRTKEMILRCYQKMQETVANSSG
jgi:hypothetical protein